MFVLHLCSNHLFQKLCIQIPSNFAIQNQHITLQYSFIRVEVFMNYFFAIVKTKLFIYNRYF
jgi:hypothetical protein